MDYMVNAKRMDRWLYPAGGTHIMEYGRSSGIPQAVSEVAGVRLEMGSGEQVANLSQIKTLRIKPMPSAPTGVRLAPRAAAWPSLPIPWWAVAGIAGVAVVGGTLVLRR